ncbi:MAG: D-glycerate dehydrogenase [Gammaproteobacteria bacterium]
MTRPRVFLTRRWPAAVEEALAQHFEVVRNLPDRPLTTAELAAAVAEFDAVCPTVTDAVTAEVIGDGSGRARILGNFGVGYNHIDIEAARAAGIAVTNTPHVLTDCTADLALTLMLMLARRAGEGERVVRAGTWSGWNPTQLLGSRLSGKVLGLIGFGRIAQAVARRAHFGFGMRILFHTPRLPLPELSNALGAGACGSVEELLECADFVSLHCPGGAATRHLIDARRLACMRPHAFLINTARGSIVDTDALVAALRDGGIAGAGLDVYEEEPNVPVALKTMDNVVLLPHLGSATVETRNAMGRRVIANLEQFFAGGEPPDRVI